MNTATLETLTAEAAARRTTGHSIAAASLLQRYLSKLQRFIVLSIYTGRSPRRKAPKLL